jgi:hypothetical protein
MLLSSHVMTSLHSMKNILIRLNVLGVMIKDNMGFCIALYPYTYILGFTCTKQQHFERNSRKVYVFRQKQKFHA